MLGKKALREDHSYKLFLNPKNVHFQLSFLELIRSNQSTGEWASGFDFVHIFIMRSVEIEEAKEDNLCKLDQQGREFLQIDCSRILQA